MRQKPFTIAVVGAGPAGLFAAEQLAEAGMAVTVYDRKTTPARKFLLAGRGGLNITHSEPLERFVQRYGPATGFIAPALHAFTPQMMQDWCKSLGQPTFTGSSGRVFPETLKASPLLRAWLQKLDDLGVRFALGHDWQGFTADGDLVFRHGDQTAQLAPDATLLALGGASWPQLGSDGAWVPLLKQANIAVAPLQPANCGFTVNWSPVFAERFAGQPLKNIAITHQGRTLRGEAMVDANGIEGNVIYALSAGLRDAIAESGNTMLTLDLRPDLSGEALLAKLRKPRGGLSLSNFLQKQLGLPPVAQNLLREGEPDLNAATPEHLAELVKAKPILLTAPFPIARAISSAGGVRLEELDGSAMLVKRPGVFVAGEMLDWEAPTGGYLLQGCFATAYRAANGIKHYLAGNQA